MLAGAYSNRFKTIEKTQIEHLKTVKQVEKGDVIARNRRLTQETNKRRRAQAQKKKHEQQREEKRRAIILSKRREEQQRATEKFQRAHVPHSRSNSRKSSPTRSVTGLDEALKLIRGSPTLSRQNSLSSTGGHRSRQSSKGYRINTYDPLSKPYFNKYSSRHMRPQSPAERAQEHAEMLDKSLRNYNDSRSLFEQQLEQHQQLLLEEQQKSLHSFNQAIKQEIESDAKLEGTEELIEDSPWMTRSDSVSSVDSLEASQGSGGRDRPQTAKVTTESSSRTNSYPRPVQPKATPLVGRVAPNSASVTTTDSFDCGSKPFQVDYSSKISTSNYNNGAIIGPIINNNRIPHQPFLLHSEHSGENVHHQIQAHQIATPAMNLSDFKTTEIVNTNLSTYKTQEADPVSNDQAWGQVVTAQGQSSTFTLPSSVSSHGSIVPSNTNGGQTHSTPAPGYSRQTTVSTLSFTSVSASPSYTSVASTNQQSLPRSTSTVTNVTPAITPSTLTMSHKTAAANSANYLTSANRPPSSVPAERLIQENTPNPNSKASGKGSINNGTLGLVHGRLAVLADIEAVANSNKPNNASSQKKTLSQRSASDLEQKEVKGILKRPESGKLRKSMSTGNLQRAGLNVKDSIEIARGARTEKENIRKKSGKKSVRFADLQYEEDIPEDTDSMDSNTDLATPVKKVTMNMRLDENGTPQAVRQRPMSARVSGSNRSNATKIARAASAGTTRPGQSQHAQDRPRAAAHIIAHSIEGNDYLISSPDKKVTTVTNNFMGKTPSVSRAATAVPSQAVIHTANTAYTEQNRHADLSRADQPSTGYHSKYVTAPVISYNQPYDSSVPKKNLEMYNENGLRIDRTPTDDEINWLWEKVRTCLNREPTPSERKTSASLAATDPNLLLGRQAAPVSNKYIDGAALGFSTTTRVAPAMYSNSVQQRAMNNMSGRQKPASANGGSYLRKYGLLQQRKQTDSGKKLSTQQQQQLIPVSSKHEPQESDVSHVPRNDITESMAAYLAAEHFAGGSMSESQVQLAMEEAHRRQMDIRAESAYRNPAGPSALSMEEQKLMESLDRLNEKLRITEDGQANKQPPGSVQRYVHPGGFRGRQPRSQTCQRGRTANTSSRVQSARHYH